MARSASPGAYPLPPGGMMPPSVRSLLAASAAALLVSCVPVGAYYHAVRVDLAPPGMSGEAWMHALAAHQQATLEGYTRSTLLTVIDFSRPSTERRLWVVDVGTGEVLMHEHVAHAVRSGGTWATSFSNDRGSYRTSLGTFITANTYHGIRGLSLRLHGIEPGINDNAHTRGIVVHGTPGVSPLRAAEGRLGRTEGCPAVSVEAARELVPLIAHGTVLFAWYPEPGLLMRSAFLDRGAVALRLSEG